MLLAEHRLVFVGGLHRSGTSPLARALAAHPQVSGFTGTGAREDEGQHLQSVYATARSLGGPGRFALDPAAHLTETSPLASEPNAQRLFDEWRPYWDLSRPVLVEKSPPNLLRTRFLQRLFPQAHFVIMIRHPVVNALANMKRTGDPWDVVLANWFRAHELFRQDAPRLERLLVLHYERLAADPAAALHRIAAFLELDEPLDAGLIAADRSAAYERQWQRLASSRQPWRRRRYEQLCAQWEERARSYGYSMRDLHRCAGFAIAG